MADHLLMKVRVTCQFGVKDLPHGEQRAGQGLGIAARTGGKPRQPTGERIVLVP